MEQKNVLRVFVGKNVNEPTDGTLIDSYTDLLDGQIAIVDKDNTVQNDPTASSCNERWRFAWRKGSELIFSPWIDGANIVKCYNRGYTAATEQISYVGWNGASGSIETTNSGKYLLRVVPIDPFKTFGNKNFYKIAEYIADSSTSQTEIADGLYDSLVMQFGKETEKWLKVERVATVDSLAALTGSSTVCKFTENSATVSVWTKDAAQDGAFTASTASVTAGTILGAPSTSARTFTLAVNAAGTGAGSNVVWINDTAYAAADAGTASQNADALVTLINAGTLATASNNTGTLTITLLPSIKHACVTASYNATDGGAHTAIPVTYGDTVPVAYKIAATTSSAATFTLDKVWVGPTCYHFDGTTSGSYSGIVTNAGGVWGLKFTGLRRENFSPGIFKYFKNRFKLLMSINGVSSTTTITYSQVAKEGQGTYEQVAELEWFAGGNSYNYGKRVAEPGDQVYTPVAAANTKYEYISITWVDKGFTTITGAQPASLNEIILAYYKDSDQGNGMVTNLTKSAYITMSAFPA